MLQTIQALHMPPSQLIRNADQRAAFGRFCISASALLLPQKILRRTIDGHQISYFRRTLLGLDIPIIYALVERSESNGAVDVHQAAAALNLAIGGDRPADIIKLFLAGSADQSEKRDSAYGSTVFASRIPEALDLGDGYERFLETLGRHTRRDMRRLRRLADDRDMSFTFEPAAQSGAGERHALGLANSPTPYRAWQIDAADRFVTAQETGFHALLRSSSGEMLSCCAGFITDGCAIVLYQLNHGAHRKASLSLTHRSFIIEHLIADRIRELVFPGGAAGLLADACRIREASEVVLIRRSMTAMIKGAAIAAARPTSRVGTAFRKIAGARLLAGLGLNARTLRQ